MRKSEGSESAVRATGDGQFTEAGRLAVGSGGNGKGRCREWWSVCCSGRHQAGKSHVLITVVAKQF